MTQRIQLTYNPSRAFRNDTRSTSGEVVSERLLSSEIVRGSADELNAGVLPEMRQKMRLLCNCYYMHDGTSGGGKVSDYARIFERDI